MLAVNHWYHRYPRNLRAAYYSMLIICWAVISGIVVATKLGELRLRRIQSIESTESVVIAPAETLRYSEMAPPPSLSSDAYAAEAALPDVAPAVVEDVTSSVPLPVPDELAEATTMATVAHLAGPSAPAASGTSAPVFILPETTKSYDDNVPAPVTFKYMKAAVMPQPLKDAPLEYPDKARALGIEGVTTINMWLRKDGTVSIVQIHKSSGNALLDSAAAKAALKSTFTPARGADGNPVNVWVQRAFRFSLTGGT
ncbi:MAG: TonB family protein [candidate division WOR-3 bacterium]